MVVSCPHYKALNTTRPPAPCVCCPIWRHSSRSGTVRNLGGASKRHLMPPCHLSPASMTTELTTVSPVVSSLHDVYADYPHEIQLHLYLQLVHTGGRIAFATAAFAAAAIAAAIAAAPLAANVDTGRKHVDRSLAVAAPIDTGRKHVDRNRPVAAAPIDTDTAAPIYLYVREWLLVHPGPLQSVILLRLVHRGRLAMHLYVRTARNVHDATDEQLLLQTSVCDGLRVRC